MKYLIPMSCYLLLTISMALVIRPNDEEMQKVNISHNIRTHGKIACTIWDATGLNLHYKWNEHYYSQPPLAYILIAGWFSVVPETLMNYRLFMVLIGLIGLLAWAWCFNGLGASKDTVFWAVLIMCGDFIYTRFSIGRPYDILAVTMMGAALGSLLGIKGRMSKVFVSHSIAALALMVHPNGVLIVVELWFLMIYLERKELNLLRIVLSAVPYTIIGSVYLYWITRDWGAWQVQFLGNIGLSAHSGFWHRIYAFVRCEFGAAYGWLYDLPAIAKALTAVLVIYLVSVFKLILPLLNFQYYPHSEWSQDEKE